jgi:hypothetical protein
LTGKVEKKQIFLITNPRTLQFHLVTGAARFFLVQNTKAGKNYAKLPNAHKIYPMVMKYYK